MFVYEIVFRCFLKSYECWQRFFFSSNGTLFFFSIDGQGPLVVRSVGRSVGLGCQIVLTFIGSCCLFIRCIIWLFMFPSTNLCKLENHVNCPEYTNDQPANVPLFLFFFKSALFGHITHVALFRGNQEEREDQGGNPITKLFKQLQSNSKIFSGNLHKIAQYKFQMILQVTKQEYLNLMSF